MPGSPPVADRRTLGFAPFTPLRWLFVATAGGALLGVAIGALRDDPAEIPVIAAFLAVLGALTAIDLHERRIPNAITYPSVVVALALSAFTGVIVDALLGMLIAGGVMAALWLVGGGRLGLGDVKLSALCGAMLGVKGAQVYLVAGVAVGAIVALIALLILRDRRATLPYGPPLVAGAVIAVALRGVLIVF